jgi:2'-5' RNA ligase
VPGSAARSHTSPSRRPPGVPPGRTLATGASGRRSCVRARRLRLFIALDLPADVRHEVDAWGRKALADSALRRVPLENLNIALLFLGHRPEPQVKRIMVAIEDFFEGRGRRWSNCASPKRGPNRGRPRLFALPALSPEAEILQVGLRALLGHRRLYRPEADERAFWPHVTVARVRPVGCGSRRPMTLHALPSGPLPQTVTDPFRGESVSLYRSDLRPAGVCHILLGRVGLTRA